jgi:hypothetical protein
MIRRAYQTDLSDAEWAYIEPHLPAPELPDARGSTPTYGVWPGSSWRWTPSRPTSVPTILAVALKGRFVVGFELLPQRARFCSALERMRLLRPVEDFGERSSPSRLFLSQSLSVARETPKVSTTSLRGVPRSVAANTFSLKSFE